MKKRFRIISLMMAVMIMSSMLMPFNTQAAKKVKISKTKITLAIGKTKKLYVLNTSKKVVWRSSNKKIASVDKNGMVKAKKQGKAIVTAKVGKKKYTCKVTVKDMPKLSNKKLFMAVGLKRSLYVTGTNKKVTWSSEDTKIATVTKKGYINAVSLGKTNIVAKVGKKKLKCAVTVEKNVTLEKSEISIKNGGVVFAYVYSGSLNLKVEDPTVAEAEVYNMLYSSDEDIYDTEDGYISPDGMNIVPIYVYGLKSGSTTLKITTATNDEVEELKVTVEKPESTSAQQKVIDAVFANNSFKDMPVNDLLIDCGYTEENVVGLKALFNDITEDSKEIYGTIYSAQDDSFAYIYMHRSDVATTLCMVSPYTEGETTVYDVIFTSENTVSNERILGMSTINPDTYSGENLEFIDIYFDEKLSNEQQISANQVLKTTLDKIGNLLKDKAGVNWVDLGFKGLNTEE